MCRNVKSQNEIVSGLRAARPPNRNLESETAGLQFL